MKSLPLKSRSLIVETILIVIGAQVFGAALLCGTALLHEHHTRLRALDIRLQGRSDSLLGAIQDAEDPDDNVMIDPSELRLPPDDIYAVYNQQGRLLGASPGAPFILVSRGADSFRNARVGRSSYRILQREAMRVIDRAENGGTGLKRPVTILYATTEDHLWHESLEAMRFYLFATAFAAGLTVVALAFLLKRALGPLTELAVATGQLSPPALIFQPPPSALRLRELRPLAEVLEESVRRLREAFAREQRFVGDAAHELKTGVAVVRSSVQLLMLRRRSVEEHVAGLQRVLEDNSRVEALVGRMLELSSLDELSAKEVPAVDLTELAARALQHLQPLADERGILLCLKMSSQAPVRVLPAHGVTLVSNLVMNAIQHSASGKRVEVSLLQQQRIITMQVQDEGDGIPPDALPHLFERFYRADGSRSRDTGGVGLGLSICHSIVTAAGGSISVENSEPAGTRVLVRLPSA